MSSLSLSSSSSPSTSTALSGQCCIGRCKDRILYLPCQPPPPTSRRTTIWECRLKFTAIIPTAHARTRKVDAYIYILMLSVSPCIFLLLGYCGHSKGCHFPTLHLSEEHPHWKVGFTRLVYRRYTLGRCVV